MKKNKRMAVRLSAVALALMLCLASLASCVGAPGDTTDTTADPSTVIPSGITSFDLEKLAYIEQLYKQYFVDEIDYDKMTDALISAYIAAAGDRFGVYFNAEDYKTYNETMSAEFSGIGVNVIYNDEYKAIEIVNVYADSPADKGGVLAGDLIVTVGEDRASVAELGYELSLGRVRGEIGTDAKFEVLRGENYEEKIAFSITREKIVAQSVYYKMLGSGENIGYIRIDQFDAKTDEAFIVAVEMLKAQGATAFVFDVRGNPGGYLSSVLVMLDYILPEGPVARIDNYGDGEYDKIYTSDAAHYLDAPMAVITNGSTASAGELFTSAIHDYAAKGLVKASTVGLKTFGKGTMQSGFALSDGSYINVTVAYYDPPYSENYHGVGLTPDVEVELSDTAKKTNIFKLAEQDDAQLLAAVAEIEQLRK